jgi:DNA processing protein
MLPQHQYEKKMRFWIHYKPWWHTGYMHLASQNLKTSNSLALEWAKQKMLLSSLTIETLHTRTGLPKDVFGMMTREPVVAIVGSRKMTPYGEAAATQIAKHCADEGYTVLSGLAYGIDSVAVRTALKNGGLTMAVLPSGLENIYPAHHRALAEQVAQRGMLLSEYPPDYGALKQHCIARNRLVAALADILIIVEGSIKSGTRHTVEFALHYGTPILGVPGNIYGPQSAMPNWIIQQGAHPLLEPSDVCMSLGKVCRGYIALQNSTQLSELATRLLRELTSEKSLSQLENTTAEPVHKLLQELTMLESEGLVIRRHTKWQALKSG